jgi:hypothetical protein
LQGGGDERKAFQRMRWPGGHGDSAARSLTSNS